MGSLNITIDRQQLLMDRNQAAQMLIEQLMKYKDVVGLVVLGIPRGGVILAEKIARGLNADLDIILTRKIGTPYNPELAVGAVAEDGDLYLNEDIVTSLDLSDKFIEEEKQRQLREIQRRKVQYRTVLKKIPLKDKIVILTDDGVATGATMHAAIWATKAESPQKTILALPVAPPDTIKKLAADADETICIFAPYNFYAISQFYTSFEQVEDHQVIEVMQNFQKFKKAQS